MADDLAEKVHQTIRVMVEREAPALAPRVLPQNVHARRVGEPVTEFSYVSAENPGVEIASERLRGNDVRVRAQRNRVHDRYD
jgi:hypothetical protein